MPIHQHCILGKNGQIRVSPEDNKQDDKGHREKYLQTLVGAVGVG